MGYMTVSQAGEKLGISQASVYRLVKRGTLAVAVIAGRYVVRDDTVDALKADTGYQRRKRSPNGAPCKPRQRRLDL